MLASLAAFAGQAAVVYKWKDPDGLVHYSDQPVPGAEKIFTVGSPTQGGSVSSARGAKPEVPGPKKKTGTALSYNQFSITSPVPDQTFFGDDVISVHLGLEPALKPNHTISWYLNGTQLPESDATATHLTLPYLDRGTYTIAATITDQSTGESLSSDSVSFFVRQPSALSPQHRKP